MLQQDNAIVQRLWVSFDLANSVTDRYVNF